MAVVKGEEDVVAVVLLVVGVGEVDGVDGVEIEMEMAAVAAAVAITVANTVVLHALNTKKRKNQHAVRRKQLN